MTALEQMFGEARERARAVWLNHHPDRHDLDPQYAGVLDRWVDDQPDDDTRRDLTDAELDAVEHANARSPRTPDNDGATDLGDDGLPVPVDWHAMFAKETDIEWLVDDLWPHRRQLQIFAAKKTGKSLIMLWIAINLALGRDPFTGRNIAARRVTYLDYEMSPDDIVDRLREMGFSPDDIPDTFRYYLLPLLPPLDTPEGGAKLMRLVERDQTEVLVFDTLSRVVQGEENSNDTYMDLYAYTGLRLKKAGIALARLDHEGHESGRARGASAKADDVDINWQVKRTDDGYRFVNRGSRVPYVADHIDIGKHDDPLRFERVGDSWPAGTKAKADELDTIGAPVEISNREARSALKEAGRSVGTSAVLAKAITLRKQRMTLL